MNNKKVTLCPHCLNDVLLDYSIFKDTRLSVMIPVYNEEKTLHLILEKVKAIQVPKEIILVDDCSTDNTRSVLEKLEAETKDNAPFDNKYRVFFQPKNQGKGSALHKAIEIASGNICIIQDADLEYDPKDYYKLLIPIIQDKAEVVYGSRFAGGGTHRVLNYWHSKGNKLISSFSNMFTNLHLTDVETCYKVFRADIIKNMQLEQKKFGFEIEVTSKLAKAKHRIFEVGIDYLGRSYDEGKKITWKDGVEAMYLILKYH